VFLKGRARDRFDVNERFLRKRSLSSAKIGASRGLAVQKYSSSCFKLPIDDTGEAPLAALGMGPIHISAI